MNIPSQEPDEVDCLVTESHIVSEAREPIKIPISHIKRCDILTPSISIYEFNQSRIKPQKPLHDTVALTFLNDLNEKNRLSFSMAGFEGYPLKKLVDTQIAELRLLSSWEESTEAFRHTVQDNTFRQLFHGVKERFRDKTGDKIYSDLQMLGIDAQMARLGRIEERLCGGHSLGIMDVRNSPISWVNIHKETWSDGQASTNYYFAEYGIPDTRLGSNAYLIRIETVLVKTIPLVGRVVDLRWEGRDLSLGIINRLNNDSALKYPIMNSHDLTITADDKYGYWIISTEVPKIISAELWSCYEAIARHLLSDWSSV